MSEDKITKMHRQYGESTGNFCKDCCNIVTKFYANRYYKCKAYGESNAESTDWRLKYEACGLYNKPFETLELKPLNTVKNIIKDNEPIEGQITMAE